MKGRFDLNKAINYKSPHLSSPEKLFYYPSVIYFTLNHFLFSDDLGRKEADSYHYNSFNLPFHGITTISVEHGDEKAPKAYRNAFMEKISRLP